MTRDFSRSYGVDYTVVRNLTGKRKFLMWFPEAVGHGRWIEPRSQIRFSGNLFETLAAMPNLKALLDVDIRSGEIAVAACGNPQITYEPIANQLVPGFAEHGCIHWQFDSSSSAWAGA